MAIVAALHQVDVVNAEGLGALVGEEAGPTWDQLAHRRPGGLIGQARQQ